MPDYLGWNLNAILSAHMRGRQGDVAEECGEGSGRAEFEDQRNKP